MSHNFENRTWPAPGVYSEWQDRDSGDEHGGRCLPKEQETIDDLIEEQQRRRLNNPICDHQARVWELEKDKANLEATVRVLLSRLEQLR